MPLSVILYATFMKSPYVIYIFALFRGRIHLKPQYIVVKLYFFLLEPQYVIIIIISTVLPKTHKAPDSYINITVAFGNGDGMIPLDDIDTIHNRLTLNNIAQGANAYKPKSQTTYKMIKEYIIEKYNFKVHTAYIAEVKRSLGLPLHDAPNAVETLKKSKEIPTPIQVNPLRCPGRIGIQCHIRTRTQPSLSHTMPNQDKQKAGQWPSPRTVRTNQHPYDFHVEPLISPFFK